MELLYTEGKFLSAGPQVLFYPIAEDNVAREPYQHEVEDHATFVSDTKDKMFSVSPGDDHVPPALGDVIWTHDGGNKWIGHCIVQQSNGEMHTQALRLCLASVQKKCISLGSDSVAMPLMVTDGDLDLWNSIYPTIEELISVQGVVYVDDNATLNYILKRLPGNSITAHYSKPQIRFK